jgi:diadenosine tetraphosphatase ApaH/serine/threonine PP2A family protein phosphatase
MRVLILSDVHANLVALEAVLADADGRYDEIWNLGDTVGYGPEPVACIDRLNAVARIQLAGNHDLACAGVASMEDFNPVAKAAATWTAQQLSMADRQQLAERPGRVDLDGITLAHGSPRDPIWEYVVDPISATGSLLHVEGDLCFVGHSHVALVAMIRPGEKTANLFPLQPGDTIDLQLGRMLINPGSVGQPRDGDPRAAYALLDTDRQTVTGCRVNYDIAATQQAMRAAHLPERLAARLSTGR